MSKKICNEALFGSGSSGLGNVLAFTMALPGTIGVLALIGGVIAIVGAFKAK